MSAKYKFQRFLITVLISISFFYGGFYYGQKGYEIEVKRNPPKVEIFNKSPSDSSVDFSLFWVVWDMVSKDYLDRPVDTEAMVYGAIKGMVDSLGDPYTLYLPPEINETVLNSINSSYQGIGAELDIRDNQLMIIAPLDGSPAKAAGILPGDKITHINGESTVGITVTEAVVKIRGDEGTVVTLTILRDAGEEPFDVDIKRGLIKVDSVSWDDKEDGTAYIRISRFGESTSKEWDNVVKDLLKEMDQLDALIIDVRGNPGGYMLSPVDISGDFFDKKIVTIQQEATGDEYAFKADKRNGVFVDIPEIFVLIDEGSASAAEILALSLKENLDNVTLVGKTSFGKGTIQNARDFSDGSGIHLTTAKWLSPKGNWVHEVGIKPDVEVDLDIEKIREGEDTQLNKAIELAKEI